MMVQSLLVGKVKKMVNQFKKKRRLEKAAGRRRYLKKQQKLFDSRGY